LTGQPQDRQATLAGTVGGSELALFADVRGPLGGSPGGLDADLRYARSIKRAAGSRWRDALMAVGLLLTTATQLRLPGLPLGPGELCLAVWMICAAVAGLGRDLVLTPALSRMLVFWALFAVAQTLGTLTALLIGDPHDPGLFWHDVLAYPMAAAFACLSLLGAGGPRGLRRSAEIFVGLGAASLVVQLIAAWDVINLQPIEIWFGDRFRGWSNNPNQLAFFCGILAPTALYLADTADRPGKRVAALLCLVPAMIAGRLTKADTFTFSILGAVPIYICLKLVFWIRDSDASQPLRAAFAWVAVLMLPLMTVSAMPFVLSGVDEPGQLGMSLMKGGGKEASAETNLRLDLWGQALDRGLDGYLLGLGPGPHLPIPPEIAVARPTEPDLDTGDHPMQNGTPNFEAHNSLLDLLTQGGLLADVSFIWLLAAAGTACYRARSASLTALLAGVVVFGVTNNIVRPPIFWFAVVLCLATEDPAGFIRVPNRAVPAD
jgi:hypothetical protein